MTDKRIAVVGAGAIGGYTGGQLAHNGFDVTLIDPWPEHVETIRKDGLALEGMTQEEFVCARPRTMHLTEAQQLAKEKPIDIAMVAVKSYDTEWATRFISQYLAPDGYVVSLQNCMNEERIAGVVGWDKTVGAIPALLGAELYAPGRVRRTAARGASPYEVYRVGEVHGRITKRLEELAEMIRTVDSVKATTNLWGERWSKLCVNGMANGVAAATAMSGNEMNRDEKIRRLSIRLAGEGVRVGQALGYQLEHIRSHEPETLARAMEGDAAALDEIETAILAALRSNTRSDLARPSMGQDMYKGRRTEIDFINGVIAEKGREVGVPTPSHVKLIEAVKRVEHGQIPAKPRTSTRSDPRRPGSQRSIELERGSVEFFGPLDLNQDRVPLFIRVAVLFGLDEAAPDLLVDRPRPIDLGPAVEPGDAALWQNPFLAQLRLAEINRELGSVGEVLVGRALAALPQPDVRVIVHHRAAARGDLGKPVG